MRTHFRPAIAAALALVTGVLAGPHPAGASLFYALVGSTIDMGDTAPRSVGPLAISGGVGSTGTASARCEAGRMTTFGDVSCPVSGLFTPQIDAGCTDFTEILDAVCPELPVDVATPFALVLHTRLTGSLAISGAHPYAASASVYVGTSLSSVSGAVALTDQGFSASGVLAGATADMNGYPVDIPITLYLAGSPADVLDLVFETHAGGTALGTEVNTATADFRTGGWELEPVGPVFGGLPGGLTLNIPSLNVYDNHWLGPSAAVAPGRPGQALALTAGTNPVRATGRFALTLPVAGVARIDLFDVRGARVAVLLDGWMPAGTHTLEWNPAAVPAGVYFASLTCAGMKITSRIAVVH